MYIYIRCIHTYHSVHTHIDTHTHRQTDRQTYIQKARAAAAMAPERSTNPPQGRGKKRQSKYIQQVSFLPPRLLLLLLLLTVTASLNTISISTFLLSVFLSCRTLLYVFASLPPVSLFLFPLNHHLFCLVCFTVFQNSKRRKELELRAGLQGFLITCDGGRERLSCREAVLLVERVSNFYLSLLLLLQRERERET